MLSVSAPLSGRAGARGAAERCSMHSFVRGLIGILIATFPRSGGTEAEDFLNSKGAGERLHALLVMR